MGLDKKFWTACSLVKGSSRTVHYTLSQSLQRTTRNVSQALCPFKVRGIICEGKLLLTPRRSLTSPLPVPAENMSTPNSSLRHRGAPKDKVKANGKAADQADEFLNRVIEQGKETATTQWEYKLALGIITVLSFITRFWGISHPNEVVFDEVHFGKV